MLLGPPNKHVIDLSSCAFCVSEEIYLRRFPNNFSVSPDMYIRVKIWPEHYRKIVEGSGFVIGELYDMPLSSYITRGVEEGPDF